MKRILICVLGAAVAFSASAQSWQDALLISENNYSGTARSVGMGNAMTAIGGDPGSLTFNPAGSAVAAYSQVFITPGVTISSIGAQGTIFPGSVDPVGLGDKVSTGYARFKMPNVGFIVNFDTGRRSGWKRMSLGFLVNATNDYTGRMNAAGVNADNSYAASLASSADGFSTNVMGQESWTYVGDASRMPAWVDMTGYRSGMFNGVVGQDGAYVALTEVMDSHGQFSLAAPVYQRYGQQTYGSKYDVILNFATNYADKLYLGLNVGVTSLSYVLSEYWQEMPNNADEFPTIDYSDGTSGRFESLRMRRNYRATGSGVYVKAGLIWRPVGGLRLGAAIQTPTLLNLIERYSYSGEVSVSGKYISPCSSPEDRWGYNLLTPFRFNLGAAYSFGSTAVLSADYEFVDYRHSNFRSSSSFDVYSSDFYWANQDIKDLLGPTHALRLGLEVKPVPALAIRAGYDFTTSPQRNRLDGNNVVALSASEKNALIKQSVSVGLGYSTGAFYVDAAFRARFVPDEYITPYYYYYAPDPAQFYNKVVDAVETPEVHIKSHLFDTMLTLGWRF